MQKNIDQIDIEELLKEFKIMDLGSLKCYLKEVYRDLLDRSDNINKGVNKNIFSKFYELPGIILDRLFAVLDKNNAGYISHLDFIDGLIILFTETFENLAKFIFKLYDYDKDGKINKEDVRIVLSYIPINTMTKVNAKSMTYEKGEIKDRVESQVEIDSIIETSFIGKILLDEKDFIKCIENVRSEIFVYIIIFLLEKRPFKKNTLKEYSNKNYGLSPVSNPRMIASPKISNSKFSPGVSIGKSPQMSKKVPPKLSSFALSDEKSSKLKNNILSKFGSKENEDDFKLAAEESPKITVKVNRKTMHQNVQLLEKSPKSIIKNTDEDLPILEGIKTSSKIKEDNDGWDSDEDEKEGVKNEGFLVKVSSNKTLLKRWFKLIHRDFYYYKTKGETDHQGMHNLSGVFVREEKSEIINKIVYYPFSVVYPKKTRTYFCEKDNECKNWIKCIRKATGYQNLIDIYDVKEKLGNGKFGLVKLGKHKETGRPVAIKIMKKAEMKEDDIEMARTEIEIMKISQHPNIIRLYDVFENIDYIYIIMEYCAGGDLFGYIEKRGFALKEDHAKIIIRKVCSALYYQHSYGIVHRDLKPENIMMTDDTEKADIKLLDFGLSKITSPGELCTEPFGTISYVAPEVLLNIPYSNCVDLWGIGILTFLLLAGHLPFDHEYDESEIARMTIQDPPPFSTKIWKKVTSDAKHMIQNLLIKAPKKRLTLNQVMDHPWLRLKTLSKTDEKSSTSSQKFKKFASMEGQR